MGCSVLIHTFDPIIPLRSKSIGDLFFVGHLCYNSEVKKLKYTM